MAPIKGTRSVLYERNLGGLYLDIIPKPDELARYGLRVADVERVIESAIGGTPIGTTDRGAQSLLDQCSLPAGSAQRPGVASRACWSRSGAAAVAAAAAIDQRACGDMPMGSQGALDTPAGSSAFAFAGAVGAPHPIFLAQNMDGHGQQRDVVAERRRDGAPASACRREPDVRRASRWPRWTAAWAAPVRWGRCRAADLPAPMMGAAFDVRRDSSRQSFVPLGQVADIKIAGGPPMVRDEAGLLVGYVYVDIDQAQRDIGGYVNEAKEVVARAMASGDAEAAAGLLPQVDGPVRAARRDARAHEDRHPDHLADHRRCCCSCSSGTSSRC